MKEGGADPASHIADRALIGAAMDQLKPEARAALVLRHYYGYDYAEIARFLRTSPGNVGSILSRAHATLRVQLAPDATEPPTELRAPRRAQR
jgi:RNA polymerase sigma-70 factor (ECF subfamily)